VAFPRHLGFHTGRVRYRVNSFAACPVQGELVCCLSGTGRSRFHLAWSGGPGSAVSAVRPRSAESTAPLRCFWRHTDLTVVECCQSPTLCARTQPRGNDGLDLPLHRERHSGPRNCEHQRQTRHQLPPGDDCCGLQSRTNLLLHLAESDGLAAALGRAGPTRCCGWQNQTNLLLHLAESNELAASLGRAGPTRCCGWQNQTNLLLHLACRRVTIAHTWQKPLSDHLVLYPACHARRSRRVQGTFPASQPTPVDLQSVTTTAAPALSAKARCRCKKGSVSLAAPARCRCEVGAGYLGY